MRQLHDHKTTPMNEKHVRVYAIDEADPEAGGAHHVYAIVVTDEDGNESTVELKFQHGPLKEAGINGITDQALLAIVLDRWRCFQKSKWSNRETAVSITKLEEAIMWQLKRTRDRIFRKVEGTNAL